MLKIKIKEIDNGFIVEFQRQDGVAIEIFCNNLEEILNRIKAFLTEVI